MNDKRDWSEKIENLSRERLIRFAVNAMGMCMGLRDHVNKTPDEMYEYIFEIGEYEKHKQRDDDATPDAG